MDKQPNQLPSTGYRIKTPDYLVNKGAPAFTLLVPLVLENAGVEVESINIFNRNKE